MKIMLCDYPSEMQRDLSYEKQLLQTGLPEAEVLTAAYRDAESFIRDMQGVSALLTAFIPLPRKVLERLPDLRIISVNAAGCNTIDVASARELGITVENVRLLHGRSGNAHAGPDVGADASSEGLRPTGDASASLAIPDTARYAPSQYLHAGRLRLGAHRAARG